MLSPRHEPPEPSSLTRIYGLVTSLTAFVLCSFYVFLTIAPTRFIVDILGEDIEGFQRIAGTIPVIILLTIVYAIPTYAFVDLMVTPPLDDYRWISDKNARPWVEAGQNIPIIGDMPKTLWSRGLVAESKRKNNGGSS